MAAAFTVDRYRTAPSVDFYHYWAVGKARRIDPGLGSPYREAGRYAAAVNRAVAGESDPRLRAANRYRRTLDLTGTPLFYTLFAALPGDYERAFRAFFSLQVCLFVASFAGLGPLLRRPFLPAAALGLALAVAYEPFSSDLRVGNVSTFQFAALTALTAALVRVRAVLRPDFTVAAALSAVPFMVLLKPNLALPGIAAAVCLGLNSSRASWRRALFLAAPLLLLALSLPSLYFGTPTVWSDWLRLAAAGEGTRLVYPVAEGNFSLTAIVSDLFGLPFFAALALVLAALLASFGGALARGGLSSLRACAADPRWAMASSTAATLALAPLAWVHYYLLLLLPAGWLLLGRHSIPGGTGLGAAALLLSSGLPSPVYASLGLLALEPGTFAAGTVVLWAAAMAALARPGSLTASGAQDDSGPSASSP